MMKALRAPLQATEPAMYHQGVFYTTGQNKAVMLQVWLKESLLKPKAIVFVDDKKSYSDSMHTLFGSHPLEVHTFHYTKEAQNVDLFNSSDKSDVIDQWGALRDRYQSLKTK